MRGVTWAADSSIESTQYIHYTCKIRIKYLILKYSPTTSQCLPPYYTSALLRQSISAAILRPDTELILELHGHTFSAKCYPTIPTNKYGCIDQYTQIILYNNINVEIISPSDFSSGKYREVVKFTSDKVKSLLRVSIAKAMISKSNKRFILLEGSSGCGKSSLLYHTAIEIGATVIRVRAGRVLHTAYSNSQTLYSILASAIVMTPCIVLLDDIDLLLPKGCHTPNVYNIIKTILDFAAFLPSSSSALCLVACASNPSAIHPAIVAAVNCTIHFPALTANERISLVDKLLADSSASPSLAQPLSDRLAGLSLISCLVACRRMIATFASSSTPILQAPDLSLTQVYGHNEAKESLRELILWPRIYSAVFDAYKINRPLGALLYGPPGTGKTLLVKTMARELKYSFIDIRLTDVVKGYIGEGESALRDLFLDARRVAPCIVFIDEFQAIFTQNEDGGLSKTGSSLSVTLSSCLDDCSTWNANSGSHALITVIAASNEPWAIQESFIRLGRLEKCIFIGPLDEQGRRDILVSYLNETYFRGRMLSISDVNFIVQSTEGYTGADFNLLFRKLNIEISLRESFPEDLLNFVNKLVSSSSASIGAEEIMQYKLWKKRR